MLHWGYFGSEHSNLQTSMSTGSLFFPLSAAHSTGTSSRALLLALLATGSLDEISNIEDFRGVHDYIFNRGRVNLTPKTGRTKMGLIFWVYPTGLHGPFHLVDEEDAGKGVVEHGLLVTTEEGVEVEEAVRKVRKAFRTNGLAHEHIPGVITGE